MMQEAAYKIRNYTPDDFDQVMNLWVETGMGRPERGDDNGVIVRTVMAGGSFLVMEDVTAGIICGTSWLTCDGRRLYLHHFGILPSYQGKGLSHILLNESLKIAKKMKYQVKLEVHRSNSKAANLYKKHGFSYLGDYDVYIIRDTENI